MKELTAIVISFLRTDYTIDCVRSLRETYPDINIIVGDQAVSRKVEKYVKRYGATYVPLKWDVGVGASRNKLIKKVKTPYVLVGDDDFLYDEYAMVDKMLMFIKNNKKFDLIAGRITENGVVKNYQGFIEIFDDHIENYKLYENEVNEVDNVSGLRFKKVDLVFNFFVARTKICRDVKWDENIKVAYEHSHWFINLKKSNKKVAFSPDPIVKHKYQNYPATEEYKELRSRKSDRDYFFKSLGIKYTKTMRGIILTDNEDTYKYNKGVAWGVWDFCHEGHLNLLERAKSMCRELIVGVSTDEFVIDRKGIKTYFNFEHRSKLIGSLKFVDRTYKQDKDFDKKDLVEKEHPDIIFVGDDWMGKEWDGSKLGVPVHYLKYTNGICSTKLRKELGGQDINFLEKITFIIKTFKGYYCLENLLKSLKKFYPKAQIMIADDNNDLDFNADFYREWRQELNIDLVRLPFDSGLSFGRNQMIDKCRTPFVLLLDDDFVFNAKTDIEKFYIALKAEPSAGVIGGVCLDNKTEVHFECLLKIAGNTLKQISDGDNYKEIDGIQVKETGCVLNFALFRRKVFKDVRWDDDLKLAEHLDFYVRLNKTNWKILYTPEVKVIHNRDRNVNDYNDFRGRSKDYSVMMYKKHRIVKVININGRVSELKDDKILKYRAK